jgi:hypothetical protein
MPAIPGGRETPKKDLGDRKCPGKPYLFCQGALSLRTMPHVPGGRLHLWENVANQICIIFSPWEASVSNRDTNPCPGAFALRAPSDRHRSANDRRPFPDATRCF